MLLIIIDDIINNVSYLFDYQIVSIHIFQFSYLSFHVTIMVNNMITYNIIYISLIIYLFLWFPIQICHISDHYQLNHNKRGSKNTYMYNIHQGIVILRNKFVDTTFWMLVCCPILQEKHTKFYYRMNSEHTYFSLFYAIESKELFQFSK